MKMRDRWFGCSKQHPERVLARIEQLERALAEIACITTLAPKRIMNQDSRARILTIIDSMKEKE